MIDLQLLVPGTLWRSDSALRCRRCGAAIRLNDEFGLSERVCAGCVCGVVVDDVRISDRSRITRLIPPLRHVA